MSEVALGQVFALSENVVSREVSGELVLMDLESGMYFGLNLVGGRIWQMLDKQAQPLAAICDAIEEEFEAPRAAIESDVTSLAKDMMEQGLIVAQAA